MTAPVLSALLALASVGVGCRSRTADRLPALTRAALDEARERWSGQGVADYDLEVRVRGRQASTYQVSVRGHQVQVATRNGQPLRGGRTMGTWSVPGIFETLAADVRSLEALSPSAVATSEQLLVVRVAFDPRFGFPARYLRREQRPWGGGEPVTWEVTRFDVQAR